MRISCEYCGAVFDSDHHEVCPKCGSPYSNDAIIKDVEAYEKKKRDYELEQAEEKLKSQKQRNEMFRLQVEEQH